MTEPAQLPAEITAGLNFLDTLDLVEYPAPTWVLTAYLRGPKALDLVATPAGGMHQFSAPAGTTKDWAPGAYWYSIRAASGQDVLEVGKGQLRILPDLMAAGDAFDGRTENEKALDAIRAVLAKRATIDQERYTINNRELWRTPIDQLIKLESHYVSKVRRERAAKSGRTTFGRPIQIRFKG